MGVAPRGLTVMASGSSSPSPSCTNEDAANAEIGDSTPTNTNVDTNVGSCGTPNATEDDGTTLTLGKTRKFISDVWDHFTLEVRDGIDKAICKYCKKALGGSSKNGTKHLRDHQRCCPMKKYRNIAQDFAQKKLKVEASGDQKGKLGYGNPVYDEEEVRRELCNMVIMHEYPLTMVDHLGFRRYLKALNPTFKMISRNTLKKDIIKIFEYEKSKTMKLLGSIKSKVAITTDMWTTQNQKPGFMAITAHWVDNSWALQSRILRFAYVPCPHTAEAISEKLMECFSDWNLGRKLSSLTVDNCASNDAVIAILKDQLDIRALPLELASESAFSTGGRFVSPYRNRLHPKTLEALMCARDWIWASIESEDVGEVTSYRHTPSADYDDGEIEDEPEI